MRTRGTFNGATSQRHINCAIRDISSTAALEQLKMAPLSDHLEKGEISIL